MKLTVALKSHITFAS
uniref:Uncharacterized protein n=1 Tax=Anguilla anguilla TaxID=7936 RepID=A0A0E9RMM6_ANGAN